MTLDQLSPAAATNDRPRRQLPRTAWTYLAFVALVACSALVRPGSLSAAALSATLAFAALLAACSIGQTFVVLSGGIDLSVPYIITTSALLYLTLNASIGSGAAIVVALGLGVLIGIVNGAGVALLSINPIVMTIGMNGLLFGFALLKFDISQLTQVPESLISWTAGEVVIGPLSVSAIVPVGLGLVLLAELVLRFTGWGSLTLLVGAAPSVARDAGLNVSMIRITVYAFSGLTAAAAGLLITGFFQQASIGMGDPYLLLTVAAVLVGGAAVTGGSGSVIGTLGGALVLSEAQVLVTNLGIGVNMQQAVTGLVIVVVAALYARSHR